MSAPWRMHRRIMAGFAAFALAVAVLFGAYAIIFTYAVEDRFFSDVLRDEAATQREHRSRTGGWTSPRTDYISLHESPSSFPADLRERYRLEPTRSEFAGDAGRHYHVLRLAPEAGPLPDAFLVAEVSEQLVVRRMRNDLLRLLGWSALVVVVFALLVGYWLARRTTAPLAALARQVELMQPDAPARSFALEFSTHEVGVLARGLESLAARVQDLVTREREFTRDASHELRTPLAEIHSTCERLAGDASLPDAAHRQVELLRQSAWRLQETVSSLLALAREEHAASPADDVAVLPLLEEVVVEQAGLLQGKTVEVTVDVPSHTRMTLPAAVLRILLRNLVGNAFAHTITGQVRIDVDGGRLRIANSDAMTGSMRDAPYQPFSKGESSTGYGLGLAIVRRLCDRYGVDLRIESGSRGTTASLALPGASATL